MKTVSNIINNNMKYINRLLDFFNALGHSLARHEYIQGQSMNYLNASEILYIHNAEDTKTLQYYMYINFASRHKLCIMFRTKEEYAEALKKITDK